MENDHPSDGGEGTILDSGLCSPIFINRQHYLKASEILSIRDPEFSIYYFSL